MADFRYRWIPTASYDIRRMEAWLEDMSEKGLILAAVTMGVGIFREETPRRRKCKILPAACFPAGKREEKLHLYERLGWECVVGLGSRFLVFLAVEETPVEIPDDETMGLGKLRWETGVLFLASLFLASAFLGTQLGSRVMRNGLYTGLLGGDMIGFLTLALLVLAGVGRLGGRFFHVCRLRASAGSLRAKKGDWKGAGRRRAVLWLSWLILLIGGLAVAALQRGSFRSGNYTEEMGLPVLSLSVIAGEDGWEYTGRVLEDGRQIDNSYTAFWRLFAPENYRVVQKGQRADGGTEILRAECRKAAFEWLAKGYYEERLAFYREEYGEYTEPDGTGWGWEDCACFTGWEEQILLFRAGRWVVLYRYTGASDLSRFASEAAFRLK